MRRRSLRATLAAGVSLLALAGPVLAHGDHDARPLARDLDAGPYVVSLWQVYPDAGDAMTPHLIVMFDGGAPASTVADLVVEVDGSPMEVQPSATTNNGWETTMGLVEGQAVSVTVSDGTGSWALAPVVVPPPPTSMLPMTELIYTSILLTAATAWWVAARTARAWRRPTPPAPKTLGATQEVSA
jgi:hypothetical protein